MLETVVNDFLTSPDRQTGDEEVRSARTLWLYGLTLFRQSRHPAAMISEAVFSCPWPFNLNEATDDKSLDNDEYRHRLVYEGDPNASEAAEKRGWFNVLEEAGVFLRKPGGYAWSYRDCRLGLQFLFTQVEGFKFYRSPFQPKPIKDQPIEVGKLTNLQARLHYRIGDWYLRAFYATAHYLPLVEAIYHSVKAIEHAHHYQFGDKELAAEQQTQLLWMAICQLRRLLMVGHRSLLFWCPGVDVETIHFDDFSIITNGIDKVVESASNGGHRGWKLVDRLRGAKEILKLEFKHLNHTVRSEGYAHGGRSAPLLGFRRPLPTLEFIGPPIQHIDAVDRKDDRWLEGFDDLLCPSLGRNDRLFDESECSRVLEALKNGKISALSDFRRMWLAHWSEKSGDDEVLFRTIWGLSELMYRIMRRAKLEYHSKGSETEKRWIAVCAIGRAALEMSRRLAPDYHHADCDMRVRILTLYGVALGYLNRFYEANRRFNEAHALVISGMNSTDSRDLARIHIRRAEMLLWQARMEMERANEALEEELEKSPDKRPTESKEVAKAYRKVIACVDHAWGALERGELCLGGVSHSSYWWYRLLALKLSSYAALADLADQRKTAQFPDFMPSTCLPFRRRIHFPTALLGLLRDAMIVGSGDIFRQLRVLHYALRADESLILDGKPVFGLRGLLSEKCLTLAGDIEQLVASAKNVKKSEQPLLYQFAEKVCAEYWKLSNRK